MNRKGGLFRVVALGMAAILCVGVWLGFGDNAYAAKSLPSPDAAVFVSKQAPVMISIFASPDGIEELVKNVDFSPLKTSLLAKTGVDYRQDIQPWIGKEITLAVTSADIDRDASNGLTPGYLMALTTNDGEKSRDFLQLLFSKRVLAGADLTTEEYAGVKIIADMPSLNSSSKHPKTKELSGEKLAGAVVADRFVLFANDGKVLREAINNVQAPDLNLPSSSDYQTAIEQVGGDGFGVAYLNVDAIARWQGLTLPKQNYDNQIISLRLDPKAIVAETAAVVSSTLTEIPSSPASLTKPVQALAYIPESASIAVAGKDLSSLDSSNLALFWQQFSAGLSGKQDMGIGQIVQPLAELEKNAGINLKNDIFSWVNGEYAIALFPKPGTDNPDWVLVAEKSDGTTGGIAKLNDIAKQKNLTITSFQLESQPISAWTQLKTQRRQTANKSNQFSIETTALAVNTSIDNYEIFASSLEVMQAVLTSQKNSLLNNRDFQKSIANIPKPNQGYVYIDWNTSQSIITRQIPILKLAKIVAKPLFEELRSLTISSYSNSDRILKGGIYLNRE